jgi:hypothetical protein
MLLQTLFQKLGGVDALTTGENLLAADKEIKGITDFL